MSEDIAQYVHKQPSGIYRYYRRVPAEVANLDKRTFIKISLKTKILKEALDKAKPIHESVERLWSSMASGNDNKPEWERYESAIKIAQSMGFAYKPVAEIASGDMVDFDRRVDVSFAEVDQRPSVARSIMGAEPVPNPRLSQVWQMYEKYHEAGLTGMSPRQMSKHKVSRQRAVMYAIEVMKDAKLSDVSRADVLNYRQWWTDKIAKDKLTAYSANRSFSDMKGMLTVIDNALQTNFRIPWAGVRLKETNATKMKKRPPFAVDWVQDRILAAGALETLNESARLIVYTMIETGMRLGEVCNLRPVDIHLDDDVPHVEVADRDDRRQKTEHSIRRIPLVGVALWAMRQAPEGFPKYADKSDVASAAINKQMRALELFPTPNHTIYSLRHTFQDRIENAGASDRMQADLMGHEFGRPQYGDGAELKRRQEFLASIKFKWEG